MREDTNATANMRVPFLHPQTRPNVVAAAAANQLIFFPAPLNELGARSAIMKIEPNMITHFPQAKSPLDYAVRVRLLPVNLT